MNYSQAWEFLLYSDKNHIVGVLLSLIFVLSVVIAITISKHLNIRDILLDAKANIKRSYKNMDERSKDRLIARLQMSSGESAYKIKLDFIEKMDLILIERSNIRSYIPLLNIYVLFFIIILIFLTVFVPIEAVLNSYKTALVLSIFVSLIPVILLDTLSIYNAKHTRSSTANFLSLLLSWLEVKNDLLYSFRHIVDDLDKPLKFYLIDSIAQLESGKDPEHVFDILSYKINTSQFFIISNNFKSVLRNGGDLVGLVKDLEDEAYMIDNEFETRISDTFMTRILLNLLLLISSFFLIASLLLSPVLRDIYTNTNGGKNIMFIATVIFVTGFLLNLKTSSVDQ